MSVVGRRSIGSDGGTNASIHMRLMDIERGLYPGKQYLVVLPSPEHFVDQHVRQENNISVILCVQSLSPGPGTGAVK